MFHNLLSVNRNGLKKKIVKTADGSYTIQIEDWNEQYHSLHGAVQEAYHVFIGNGLELFRNRRLSVLEMGFGTGLNAFISLIETEKLGLQINYVGVEAYPLSTEEVMKLRYPNQLGVPDLEAQFQSMHESSWGAETDITPFFSLKKLKKDFKEINVETGFDLIYFDAFGARVQPELWTAHIFEIAYKALKYDGVLVTYAAKGSVRRAMQEVGFSVERLPGPPGKREMLRARKAVNKN